MSNSKLGLTIADAMRIVADKYDEGWDNPWESIQGYNGWEFVDSDTESKFVEKFVDHLEEHGEWLTVESLEDFQQCIDNDCLLRPTPETYKLEGSVDGRVIENLKELMFTTTEENYHDSVRQILDSIKAVYK